MPKTLALMAVQRQTAASRSARPPMSEQHAAGFFGGLPTTTFTKSFSKLAHTPNFRVSLGHLPPLGPGLGPLLGGVPVPGGLGTGPGPLLGGVPVPGGL
ncbi:hypothetical protein ACJIZ3_018675 [Penstemon smallii]|uniref:Uncharacterized protein n=1 Tax=Penstemon smallii TaxID=265156 RepID=A0ABD3T084_9LAMI